MKRTLSFVLAVFLTLTTVSWLAGCADTGNNGKGKTEIVIDMGDKNNPTFGFTADGGLAESSASKQETLNKLQATDDFGRSITYVDGNKTDKDRYVGIFYFTWLGWHGTEMNGVYDVSKLLDDDPNALWNVNGTQSSPLGKYHFWGEPLYGYYNSKDPWVIRKHMELFIYAGIDFIAFDCTNGFDYIDVITVILEVMEEMRLDGWNVPKFMFYLNTDSRTVIKQLYSGRATASDNVLEKNGIYKNGYYKELWFAPEGKPKIVAITDPNSTNGEGAIPAADHVVVDTEILAFFDIWESTWPNKTQYPNGLPWMDWTRPQNNIFTDTVNVGVAQHNSLPFSDALLSTELADNMWGRGYTTANGADHSDEAIESAQNFEEQWKWAKEKDKTYTFVTGWNEWVAIKSAANLSQNSQYPECRGKRVYFVDTVNFEYSRDIEMMKGGYADNVYMSLVRNSRDHKGKAGTLPLSGKKTIDIAQGMTQWGEGTEIYAAVSGFKNRDYQGFVNSIHYKDDSIKNDIEEIRVTHDDDNIYFLVTCSGDIAVNAEAANWMNILIDVEGLNESKSWYGYEYAVNRRSSYSGECGVDTISQSGGEVSYSLTGKASFTVSGKHIQFSIPRSALGIKGKAFTINYKVADNVTEPENMESYYTTGRVVPVGRMNYSYKGD